LIEGRNKIYAMLVVWSKATPDQVAQLLIRVAENLSDVGPPRNKQFFVSRIIFAVGPFVQ
jgi:hypothetical protein